VAARLGADVRFLRRLGWFGRRLLRLCGGASLLFRVTSFFAVHTAKVPAARVPRNLGSDRDGACDPDFFHERGDDLGIELRPGATLELREGGLG
jgi:hypothetical protein